jgi:hypothetical protein
MVFNSTFNNISVILRQSVLLVEETGVPEENCKRKSNNKIFFQFDSYRRGRNRMVVEFITNYAISAYHH